MKIILKIYLYIAAFIVIPLSAVEVIAVVNGESITQKDVNDYVVKSIPGANYNVLNDTQKKSVINQMIERKLFLEDAKKTEVANNPEYLKALKKVQENLMLDYWMKEKVEEIFISEEVSKGYYVSNNHKFSKPASVKVRHILVATEKEALVLIGKLEGSVTLRETFIDLAKTKSTGPSSVNGGELDWFVYEQMVPEFSEAAFALKKGSITQKAVQTQFGHHIIFLEDKKDKGSIPYETVKEDIVKSLRLAQFKTKLDKLSKKLKKTAKIIVK